MTEEWEVQTNVSANRRARKWSRAELIKRGVWAAVHPLFSLSPRLCWGWRRFILRRFGATIGNNVHIWPTARITIPWNLTIQDEAAVGDGVILYALGPITIGECATVSQGAHLCAGSHDWRDPAMPLVKPPITIGANVWVCADVFIGPNVAIGDGAILSARAVVMSDVPPRAIAAGNPAKVVSTRKNKL